MTKAFLYSVCLFCGLALVSCSKEETTTPTAPTLYERVGGTTMVADPANSSMMIEKGRLTLRNVVDSSIMVIAADTRLAKYFPVLFAELGAGNTTGLSKLSKNFTDFMCYATGSKTYSYTGLNMKSAHDPSINSRISMKINASDFDAFVGDIGVGLAKNGVTSANNAQLVTDLVALLNTTKVDIVQQ
ncbi:MAG: group 1 truncated hemoglobin [Candidatus Kapabacteria bacterium]|nr:group 1 truncated hemoglobin [Candidatus Kapabacteria bacterium]MBX7155712.1 group 1 truncated hemoglobin [Bacteroidota bacterium]